MGFSASKNKNPDKSNIRINECIQLSSQPFKELDPIDSEELSKVICKIVLDSQIQKIYGTGFFLEFQIDQEWFRCLVSCDHIIDNNSINNNNIIYIYYDKDKAANIKLDKNKRYIKSFIDQELDITVVEIIEDDNISKNFI